MPSLSFFIFISLPFSLSLSLSVSSCVFAHQRPLQAGGAACVSLSEPGGGAFLVGGAGHGEGFQLAQVQHGLDYELLGGHAIGPAPAWACRGLRGHRDTRLLVKGRGGRGKEKGEGEKRGRRYHERPV